MPQKKAPEGQWYRCPKPGCGFCHKDAYTITSDKRHFGRAHPGYTDTYTDIFKTLIKISEEEGLQWKKEHPDAYRFGKRTRTEAGEEQDSSQEIEHTPGFRARPRKSANPVRTSTAMQQSDQRVMSSVTHPEESSIASDPDAMELDSPTSNPEPPICTPAPEPADDYKWKCYVCNKYYTARASVKTHFLSQHLSTHHLYQPDRVPKVAFNKTTGRVVKLVEDIPQRPHFTGLAVELRQLIFEQVLSISQHPEETDDVFHVQALQLPGILANEAKAALQHSNLLIRISVYHSDSTRTSRLAHYLCRGISAVLEPALFDALELESAVHITMDDLCVQDGPKTATSFVLAYNEGTFAPLVRRMLHKMDDILALSIKFRTPFAARRHRRAAAVIVRYLGYLRGSTCTAVSDAMSLIETSALKQSIDADYTSPHRPLDLLKVIIKDAEQLMQSKEYIHSLATLSLATKVGVHTSTPFSNDPFGVWENALDDLMCRLSLACCQVINAMVSDAIGCNNLLDLSLDHIYNAVSHWGEHAFKFSVILDSYRGQAHLARGFAHKNLAKYLKACNGFRDTVAATRWRGEARKDFFFAGLLLEGQDKLAAQRELTQLDYYDNVRTTAESAGLVRGHRIQYGQTWTGDARLLEMWKGSELDNIVDRRMRPDGWE